MAQQAQQGGDTPCGATCHQCPGHQAQEQRIEEQSQSTHDLTRQVRSVEKKVDRNRDALITASHKSRDGDDKLSKEVADLKAEVAVVRARIESIYRSVTLLFLGMTSVAGVIAIINH